MRYVVAMALAASVGCGDPGSKTGGGDATNNGSGGGSAPDALPVSNMTGDFATGRAWVIIDLYTSACSESFPCEGDEENVVTDISVAGYGESRQFVSLDEIVIRADGEEMPAGASFRSIPFPAVLEIDVADDIGSMTGIRYETRYLPPHEITAPAAGAELPVGEPVTVEWSPNDPQMRFQAVMQKQPRDGTYAPPDEGTFLIEGDWVVDVEPDERLEVGRRAIFGFEGTDQGGFVHTHTREIPVSVVP